jgi:hypothetical protein
MASKIDLSILAEYSRTFFIGLVDAVDSLSIFVQVLPVRGQPISLLLFHAKVSGRKRLVFTNLMAMLGLLYPEKVLTKPDHGRTLRSVRIIGVFQIPPANGGKPIEGDGAVLQEPADPDSPIGKDVRLFLRGVFSTS